MPPPRHPRRRPAGWLAAVAAILGPEPWDLLTAAWSDRRFLPGGSGPDDLEQAGAYRVYQDPADWLRHRDEVGVRAAGPPRCPEATRTANPGVIRGHVGH